MRSGAKNTSGGTGHGNPWLRRALGQAAVSASRSQSFLGARHRRLLKRKPKKKALAVGRVRGHPRDRQRRGQGPHDDGLREIALGGERTPFRNLRLCAAIRNTPRYPTRAPIALGVLSRDVGDTRAGCLNR
ncbi:hypothetical protein ABZ770_34490 [Streptomyces sp. NPDC006654]|uniref:hypothetical protein n=1 Tax=Streptomyces sp. NPDC006654 TaxID=3156897 RepID=UPI0033CEA79A